MSDFATSRRALLLRNPQSRLGGQDIAPVLQVLAEGGIEVQEPEVEPPQWTEVIEARARDVGLLIVGGGDGSLNCAAKGLLATGLPLGILPLGTANDLARTLGLPVDPVAAARTIVAGHEKRIDIGLVNDRPYFNVASIGISAELAAELTGDVKRRFGRLGYALTAMKVLTRARPFTALVHQEGSAAHVKTLQIAVGNGRFYGGGMTVHHEAEIDDHRLHLYSLELTHLWKLLLMAPAFRAGRHVQWEEVRSETGCRFEVHTRRPRHVNADGEIITKTPAVFTVKPEAVRVRVPPPG